MRFLLIFTLYPFLAAGQHRIYTVEAFAGSDWNGDGHSATSAVLVQPQGLAVAANGDVYIADAGDHRIRKVDTAGTIRTVAGTGVPGIRGDGGPAAQAQLNAPYGLTFDSKGNLYIADLGNACIRRLSPDGNLTTVVGGGKEPPMPTASIPANRAKLNQPRDVAVDAAGNLYIADFGSHVVYQVTTDGNLSIVAGTGVNGSIDRPTPAVEAMLSHPAAVATDATGALYIADSGNRRVRRLSQGLLTTLIDSRGVEIEYGTPTGIEVDALGRIFVADGSTHTTVLLQNGDLATIALGGTSIAVSAGYQFYSTSERVVLTANGATPAVFAGTPADGNPGDGHDSARWRFTAPAAAVRDAADALYIADTGNGRVRRLSASGEMTTVTSAIQAPISLALDPQGRLYVGDRVTGGVYRLDAGNQPRLFAQVDNRLMTPAALAFDSTGNLFIADSANGLIRRVNSDGVMTLAAGGGSQPGDGPALTARLASPSGLAFDATGALWFTEAGTGKLRRLSGGMITTLAGTELREPRSIRLDADGNFLIADTGLHRVLRVAPDGTWTPLAGTGDRGFSGDGELALAAMFSSPSDVLPEADGSILVVDTGNNRIRRLRVSAVDGETPVEPGQLGSVSVIHAGTLKQQAVAPGQLVYVTAAAFPAGAEVRFGDQPASVLAQSADRLVVEVPPALKAGTTEVTVAAGGATVGKASVGVVTSAPALLTAEASPWLALAANEDGQVNSQAAPAARGSIVIFYVTGEGPSAGAVTAEIGGYPAEVLWAGAAPGLRGLMQVNVRTPGGFAPSGAVPVVLTVAGQKTQPGVMMISR